MGTFVIFALRQQRGGLSDDRDFLILLNYTQRFVLIHLLKRSRLKFLKTQSHYDNFIYIYLFIQISNIDLY